jgi:hypothetical protein
MQVEEYRALLAKKKPTKRRVNAPPPLPLTEMLARHEATQKAAPWSPRVRRPVPRGQRVAIFCLPLELCQSQDARRHRPGWAMCKDRETILERWLRPQWMTQPRRELSLLLVVHSRPKVLCVRYSSVEPDALASWGKQVVDCLQIGGVRRGKPFDGLGLIRNDCPKECEVVEWWEPAHVNQGFCVFEVWSG